MLSNPPQSPFKKVGKHELSKENKKESPLL